MLDGFRESFKIEDVANALCKRGTLSEEEYDAISLYAVSGGSPEIAESIHKINTDKGRQRRGHSKLLYVPGYFAEIERKVKDHIIPFVRKEGIYKVLR